MLSQAIKVNYFCRYLTNVEIGWRDEDYKARAMVRAIKGDPYKGSFRLRVNGSEVEFNEANSDRFRSLCHHPLASILKQEFPDGGTIVPIPTSKTVSIKSPFRTNDIAMKLARTAGDKFDCAPLLLFRRELDSSRSSGNRNPYMIESELVINGDTDRNVILFDDVVTKGAHVQACTWKLSDAGANVLGAISFARTVQDNGKPAFGNYSEDIDITRIGNLFEI